MTTLTKRITWNYPQHILKSDAAPHTEILCFLSAYCIPPRNMSRITQQCAFLQTCHKKPWGFAAFFFSWSKYGQNLNYDRKFKDEKKKKPPSNNKNNNKKEKIGKHLVKWILFWILKEPNYVRLKGQQWIEEKRQLRNKRMLKRYKRHLQLWIKNQ